MWITDGGGENCRGRGDRENMFALCVWGPTGPFGNFGNYLQLAPMQIRGSGEKSIFVIEVYHNGMLHINTGELSVTALSCHSYWALE